MSLTAADVDAALRFPFNPEKKRNHAENIPLRPRQFNGRRQRGAVADVLRRSLTIGPNCSIN